MDRAKIYEKVCDKAVLSDAFMAVRKNKGAPGVDGVTIKEFEQNLEVELTKISEELISWKYVPQAVRRVEIPKADGTKRLLGVPTVRDRVVQSAIKMTIEPIFDSNFSEHSYGFRPGRNQRQAVEAAQGIVQSGKEWVVDIDLSKFFDRINHDRLIYRLGLEILDKRILRLIGMILRSGVMKGGLFEATEEGSPQGGPLSPLLSNIVLDELDKELESRGLEFCRFADDCNIFVGSHAAAERVMSSVSEFIEKRLKLVVNRDKSQVARTEFVKFLGMTIVGGTLAISKKSMNRAMTKVYELTPIRTHHPIEKSIKELNKWYVGWANYYAMTQYPAQLKGIEAHARRRFRARFVRQAKKKRHLYAALVKRGVKPKAARKVFGNHGRWKLSHTSAVEKAYSNIFFMHKLGMKTFSDRTDQEHWFDIKRWIKLI